MLVTANIYVRDVPGQLVAALEPMSTVNANIIGVVHSRDQTISGRISVDLTFDIDPDLIDTLKKIWISKDVIISTIGSVVDLHNTVFMVIGDVNAAAMDEMMDAAKEKVGIETCDIRISSKSSGNNTAMVTASVKTEEDLDTLSRLVAEGCRSKGYTYIGGVE